MRTLRVSGTVVLGMCGWWKHRLDGTYVCFRCRSAAMGLGGGVFVSGWGVGLWVVLLGGLCLGRLGLCPRWRGLWGGESVGFCDRGGAVGLGRLGFGSGFWLGCHNMAQNGGKIKGGMGGRGSSEVRAARYALDMSGARCAGRHSGRVRSPRGRLIRASGFSAPD